MKNKSKKNGLMIVTGAYFILMIVISIGINFHHPFADMKPNEWGDYFAGFFAPLAFLWLIFGYFQNNKNLEQNSIAITQQAESLKQQAIALQQQSASLDLQIQELAIANQSYQQQVEEMKKSVEAQTNMFNLAEIQYKTSQKEKTESAKPRLQFVGTEYKKLPSSDEHYFNLSIINAGERITNIVIKSNNWALRFDSGAMDGKKLSKHSQLSSGEELYFLFYLKRTNEIPFIKDTIQLTYTDRLNASYDETYDLKKLPSGFVTATKTTHHQTTHQNHHPSPSHPEMATP